MKGIKKALRKWFKNLKTWQKGGLIGGIVGLFFAFLLMASFYLGETIPDIVEEWVFRLHAWPYFIFFLVAIPKYAIIDSSASVTIIILYAIFGALAGRVQQSSNPYIKWSLTSLLVIILILFYWANISLAIRWEHSS